jgi:hypothetical protein
MRGAQVSRGKFLSCPAMQADRQLVPHGVAVSGDVPASRHVELAGFPLHGPFCAVSLISSSSTPPPSVWNGHSRQAAV